MNYISQGAPSRPLAETRPPLTTRPLLGAASTPLWEEGPRLQGEYIWDLRQNTLLWADS